MSMSMPKQIINEGHRGYFPLQNCSEGFKKCLTNGADGIETDLWLMKDNNILVHHGLTSMGLLELIDKKTQKKIRIYARDLVKDDLKNYLDQNSNQPMITLTELLEIFKVNEKVYLNLEIKDHRIECFNQIMNILERVKPKNEIQISSFNLKFKSTLSDYIKKSNFTKKFSFGFLAKNQEQLDQILLLLGFYFTMNFIY